MDECLSLLRRLWTGEEVTFQGEFWSLDGVRLGLSPRGKPHPPIWVAAGWYLSKAGTGTFGVQAGDREGFKFGPLDRVARLSDGWLTSTCTPEEFRSGITTVRQMAAEKYRRDPATIEAVFSQGVHITSDADGAFRELKWHAESYQNMPIPDDTIRRWNIIGKPDACIREMQTWAEAGVEVFIICVRARDYFSQVRAMAKEILPAFA